MFLLLEGFGTKPNISWRWRRTTRKKDWCGSFYRGRNVNCWSNKGELKIHWCFQIWNWFVDKNLDLNWRREVSLKKLRFFRLFWGGWATTAATVLVRFWRNLFCMEIQVQGMYAPNFVDISRKLGRSLSPAAAGVGTDSPFSLWMMRHSFYVILTIFFLHRDPSPRNVHNKFRWNCLSYACSKWNRTACNLKFYSVSHQHGGLCLQTIIFPSFF